MRTLTCAVILAASAAPALAQSDHIGARYRLWRADIEGEIRADDGGLLGDLVDLDSTLDVETGVSLNNVGVWLGVPVLGRVVVDYWWGEFEGEETLERSVTFAGETFAIGERVTTVFDWQIVTAAYEYSLTVPFSSETLGLRVGVRLGFKGGTLEATMGSTLTGEESVDLQGGIPVIGASAELFLADFLSVNVEIDGLSISSDLAGGWSGRVIDYAIAVRANFMALFGGVGFRSFSLSIDDERANVEEIEGDLEISGYFAEVGARF